MKTRPQTRALAVIALTLAAALSACGTTDSPASPSTKSPSAGSNAASNDPNLVFAQCMREKGFDVPDTGLTPDQLNDTTMNPDTRRLLRVGIPEHDSETTLAAFTRLMGKGEAAARRSRMEAEGDRVEADI